MMIERKAWISVLSLFIETLSSEMNGLRVTIHQIGSFPCEEEGSIFRRSCDKFQYFDNELYKFFFFLVCLESHLHTSMFHPPVKVHDYSKNIFFSLSTLYFRVHALILDSFDVFSTLPKGDEVKNRIRLEQRPIPVDHHPVWVLLFLLE